MFHQSDKGNSLRIAIGWDAREAIAYDVCAASLSRHATHSVDIQRLDQGALRGDGLFWRPFEIVNGQRIDTVDGRPFSTDFAFTRFLLPEVCRFQGFALFVDCDFLFIDDVTKLFALADPTMAVQVVKHDYAPKDGVKMDGQSQQAYPRKNWSSCILWNCGHPANRVLTRDVVNTQTGRWLHAFSWLKDEEIGALPEGWNWLEGHSDIAVTRHAIHYTRGGPWFDDYRDVQFAELWLEEAALLEKV